MRPELFSIINSILQFFLMSLVSLFFVVAISVFGASRPRSSSESVSREHPWALLARQNQLKFKPKFNFFGLSVRGPQVTGVYRSHNVHLSLVAGTTKQNTSLVLTADLSLVISPQVVSEPAKVSPRLLLKLMTPHGLPASWRGGISIDLPGRRVIYLQEGEETDLAYLQTIFNIAADLVEAYPQVVAIGGSAVPALIELTAQQQPLRYIATQCLYRISQKTEERLGKRMAGLLCPECLVRCAVLPIRLPRQRSFYYGCLRCGQSQQFLEINDRQIVVVLDRTAAERFIELPGQVRVNWFAYTRPFDFNEVEIIQADDEAVERFAVQLGNDTNPVRRPRYRQMRCRIATDCSLSENTIRILQRIFREVEQGEQRLEAHNE